MSTHNSATWALVICFLCLATTAFAQRPRDAATLFEQLQHAESTDAAADALLASADANAATRRFLAKKLPDMIDAGWKGCYPQWRNAARLAGDLRIAGAAPALAKWISLDDVGETSAGAYQRLETNPAGKALSQIGDPAIPVLVNILHNGTAHERQNVYLVLYAIGSPLAKFTIRRESVHETDPWLRAFAKGIAASESSGAQP